MRNIALILFLFVISFRVLPQGSYCSRNTAEEASVETYLVKRAKNYNASELIVEINRELKGQYDELVTENDRLLRERGIELGCSIQPGFCGVEAIRAFGYFQDGVFDNYKLSNTITKDMDTYKLQTLPVDQLKSYLKENYTNKDQDISTYTISGDPSKYSDQYFESRIKTHLKKDGEHAIVYMSYVGKTNINLYQHAVNVIRLNNKIYYTNSTHLTTYLDLVLLPRDSNMNNIVSVFLINIR